MGYTQSQEMRFSVRKTLAEFIVSDKLYDKFIIQDKIIDVSQMTFFNDEMFFDGIFSKLKSVMSDDRAEIMRGKTLYFNREALSGYSNVDVQAILEKEPAKGEKPEYGLAYTSLLYKSLYWELFPQGTTTKSSMFSFGSSFTDDFLPLSLVMLFDSVTLQKISDLLTFSDKQIAGKVISELRQIPRLACYSKSFDLLEHLEALSYKV